MDGNLKSQFLYRINKLTANAKYESSVNGPHIPLKTFKQGLLAGFKLKATFYSRISELISLPPGDGDNNGKKPAIIKYKNVIRQEDGGNVYFFVFKNHETRLERYRELINKTYDVLKTEVEFQVQNVADVPLGGLLVVQNENEFRRIRVTEVNQKSKLIKFWAVDEGSFGECSLGSLFYLNNFCVQLDMLVVPGIIDEDSSASQIQKFIDGKFCMAKVMEPKFHYDAAPRLITFPEY